MKYSRFEILVLSVGAASVLGSLFFTVGGAPIAEEIIAQILLLVVLFSAVHWGRSGGFIAALLSSAGYVLLRIPLVIEAQGLTLDIASLVAVRVLTYGLIGIVGGELCTRIKYVFARLEGSASIDESSRVYNQRFMARSLEVACGQFARYETPYAAVIVELAPNLTEGLRTSKQLSLVRAVASFIRGDIRLVDEVGRLDDGSFLVLLPQTAMSGAQVAGQRLGSGIRKLLGAREASVVVTIMAAPEDAAALVELRTRLSDNAPLTTAECAAATE